MSLDAHASALGDLELGPHLRGAIASPLDPRDFDIRSMLDMAAPLPKRYVAPLMPPVLNQGNTGRCVAASLDTVRRWEARHAGAKTFPNLDYDWLYHQAGGTADEQGGLIPRVALDVLLHLGIPLVGHPDTAAQYRIGAYYANVRDVDVQKRVIMQLGPIEIATLWFQNQFSLL